MKRMPFVFVLSLALTCLIDAGQLHAQAWVLVGNWGFVTDPSSASMAMDTGGTPYVVAQNAAQVEKFNGASWVDVGAPVLPTSGSAGTCIAIDKNGVPYVVYIDFDNNQRATVKKYNSGSWVTVGTQGFTVNSVANTVIAIDTAGTPYVAYNDYVYGAKVTVMKFVDTSWVTVGSPGFSAGNAAYLSLALNNSGTPYVAYQDGANNNRATVMTYDGAGWVAVGSPGLSEGSVAYTSLAIDTGGTPYVAYQDGSNNDRPTVMQYDGSEWLPVVALTGFSAGVECTSLAIDKSGALYLAFLDGANDLSVTVMKYDGAWTTVGNRGFTMGFQNYCFLVLDNNSIPYVMYHDVSYCSVSKIDTALAPVAGPAYICAGEPTVFSDLKSGGTWSTGDTTVITLDSAGTVTGLRFGEATISYSKDGYAAILTIFIDSMPNVSLDYYQAKSLCSGDSIVLLASVFGSWNSITTPGIWISLDTAIATVDQPIGWNGAWMLRGKATGVAPMEYVAANDCGTDTTGFSFRVGYCPYNVQNTVGNPSQFFNVPATPQPIPPAALIIYPNPTTTQLTISAPENITAITITNLLGQTVYNSQFPVGSLQASIDLAALPSGVYLVRVSGPDSYREVRKFVKG